MTKKILTALFHICLVLLCARMAAAADGGIPFDWEQRIEFKDLPQPVIRLMEKYYTEENEVSIYEFEDYGMPWSNAVDLNGDGENEYVIFEPAWSGMNPSGVGTQSIVGKTQFGWQLIDRIEGPWIMEFGPEKENGMLTLHGVNTMSLHNFLTDMVWNGSAYDYRDAEKEYYSVDLSNSMLNLYNLMGEGGAVIERLTLNQCVASSGSIYEDGGRNWLDVHYPQLGWTTTKYLKKSNTCGSAYKIMMSIHSLLEEQYEQQQQDVCKGDEPGVVIMPALFTNWLDDLVADPVLSETWTYDEVTGDNIKQASEELDRKQAIAHFAESAEALFNIIITCEETTKDSFLNTFALFRDSEDTFHIDFYPGIDCLPRWHFKKIGGAWKLIHEEIFCAGNY